MKIYDGIPEGWVKLTAYTNGTSLVVCGQPYDDLDGDEGEWHNCDLMGCGSGDHVLFITVCDIKIDRMLAERMKAS